MFADDILFSVCLLEMDAELLDFWLDCRNGGIEHEPIKNKSSHNPHNVDNARGFSSKCLPKNCVINGPVA